MNGSQDAVVARCDGLMIRYSFDKYPTSVRREHDLGAGGSSVTSQRLMYVAMALLGVLC